MKKSFVLVLFSILFFLTSCNSTKTNPGINDNGENDYLSNENRYSVVLEDQSELVNWWKNTNLLVSYEGQYKELNKWKTELGEIVVPYYEGKELSNDISIIPESKMESAGMYFRYYTDEITCIIQVYHAESANLNDIRENYCQYRFGKKSIELPNDATTGIFTMNNKEVSYGLCYSEPMERTYLTFLYSDCFIVTIGYMDSSEVNMFDFLEDLSFQEVAL